MKKIIYCLLILGFLTSCKECKPGQKEPEVSFEVDGVYSVRASLVFRDRTFDYGGICVEIQKPDTAVIRFVGLKEVKDVRTKWQRVEEGKYEIDYDGKKAFFYDYIMDRDPKSPEIKYMLTFSSTKPSSDDADIFTGMSKLFNDTLDDCTSYKREEMNQDPDPGPDN
ncbi:hypothetical protein FH582_16030 [Leptospira interrogans]|uniref:hypothetical protein n=1 Tax=Leptospira interrogans TaxID=173 RepID=UPI001F0D2A06|nr:hypothetical protein [Leptospira interrogans]UMQ53437.1 hypothetical protein FH582_16030 [Leptospira interrogans]